MCSSAGWQADSAMFQQKQQQRLPGMGQDRGSAKTFESGELYGAAHGRSGERMKMKMTRTVPWGGTDCAHPPLKMCAQ